MPTVIKCDRTTLHTWERGTTRLPGDPRVHKGPIMIFDHPFFWFYHDIFPLLKKEKMRVLLGVCPRYILEETLCSESERRAVPEALAMQDGFFEKAPFCTWSELYEMVRSGYVEVACHSFSKMNLTLPFVDLDREVVRAKASIEEHVPQVVTSFLYPFGKVDHKVRALVSRHYRFAFR